MGYVVVSGVLKQVWDLSDEDNDSMLSLREFCTALYFMERFREGRALPSTLPAGIHPEDLQGPVGAAARGPGGQSTPVWRHIPGLVISDALVGGAMLWRWVLGGWEAGVGTYQGTWLSDIVVCNGEQVLHRRRLLVR